MYLYIEQCLVCPNYKSSNKTVTFGYLRDMDLPTNLIRLPGYLFFCSYIEPYSPMSRFCKQKYSINTVTFHQTMQNEYSKFLYFCHSQHCHDRCHINWVQDFHLMLYLSSYFLWLNTENNADPYIIKPPILLSTIRCDNEPQCTLFS